MSDLMNAIIAAKLMGNGGGSGGGSGSGSVLPPFKFYALALTYDSTTEIGEGRVYRCKDGQFERTHVVVDFTLGVDVEAGTTNITPGELIFEEGASEEDMSDAGQPWLANSVNRAMFHAIDPDSLDTLLPLMVFLG